MIPEAYLGLRMCLDMSAATNPWYSVSSSVRREGESLVQRAPHIAADVGRGHPECTAEAPQVDNRLLASGERGEVVCHQLQEVLLALQLPTVDLAAVSGGGSCMQTGGS